MSRNFEPCPTITNVTPGGRATLNLPLGLSYDQITFVLTDCTPADLKNFKVLTGSKAQWDVSSGETIKDLNQYYGRAEKADRLTLWFYRPEMALEEERKMFTLGTLDIPSLTIQFDIDPAVVATVKIKAKAIRRGAAPMGLITKLREYPRTFATAGRQDIDNIPRGARIAAMHLQKADVSEVELEINNGSGTGKIVDLDKGDLEAAQEQYKRAPISAKYTHVDLNLLGKMEQFLPTANLQDMRLKPVIDSAGALTTLVEYIDGYYGI